MSNIKREKEDLLTLKEFIEKIDHHEVTQNILEETLQSLLPKQEDKLLIGYNFEEKGPIPAYFYTKTESIHIHPKKLKQFVLKNTIDCGEIYKIKDINMLRNYIYSYVLLHEREHAYQYLIANGNLSSPNSLIKKGYNGIIELSRYEQAEKESIKKKLSRYFYIKNNKSYIMERNACLESYETLRQLS